MKVYLKWINPLVCILILVICTYLYLGNVDGLEDLFDISDSGLGMYFFAKGLFCSSMLFLFGEFLKRKLFKE